MSVTRARTHAKRLQQCTLAASGVFPYCLQTPQQINPATQSRIGFDTHISLPSVTVYHEPAWLYTPCSEKGTLIFFLIFSFVHQSQHFDRLLFKDTHNKARENEKALRGDANTARWL